MIQIEALQIDIIDTRDNTRVLQLENVAVDSVRLIYNGNDDRFGTLTSSELHFSMLVENAEDGKFFHLFTGSETRYKVTIYIITDQNILSPLWEGFLLAEQFEEPYVGGNFFTDFVASDGMGRIKNKKFIYQGASSKLSVIDVLGRCLLQTGLNLPICFSKAIENSFFELDYLDLEVDVEAYKSDNLSYYDVLEKLLTSIGCRVFQYKAEWWVVGLTRFAEFTIPYSKYVYNNEGVFEKDGDYMLEREILDFAFEATPIVSVLPPLKIIEAFWDAKENSFVVPEDLVSHFPKNYSEDKQDTTPRYWKLVTGGKINAFRVFVVHEFDVYDLDSFYHDSNFVSVNFKKTIAGPFFLIQSKEFLDQNEFNGQSGVIREDVDTNYITLEEPFYLDLEEDEFLSFELELEIPKRANKIDQELLDAIENNSLKGAALYGITYKKLKHSENVEFVISNFSETQNVSDAFDFEFRYEEGKVKARIFIEEFHLKKKGYYNIRLYPVIKNELLGANIYYNKCHLKFRGSKEKDFSIERDVDFTTSLDLDFFHSSTERLTTNKRFYLSERIQAQIDLEEIPQNEILIDQRYYNKTTNSLGQVIYLIGLNQDDIIRYELGYQFYVKKEGSSLLEALVMSSYTVGSDATNGYYFLQIDYNLPFVDHYYIQENDELYLKASTDASEEIKYKEAYSNSFTRYYTNDSQNFSKAIVQSYHDLLDSYKVRFTGNLLGMVMPFDMVQFRFKGLRLGTITNLELNFTEGTSEVVLIDHKKGEIIQSQEDIILSLESSIEISATIHEPSSHWSLFDFTLWYYLGVTYRIENISPIDASLKAVQLDGNPNDIFSPNPQPTGLIIENQITQANGNYRFDFPNPIGDYEGFYEVTLEQDNLISNKVIVELQIPQVDSRQIVLERVRVESLPNSVLRMYYTIELVGFDPEPQMATEISGMTTLITVSNPDEITREISLGQSEYYADFETIVGFYVKVEAEGVTSNIIHSYL